MAYAEKGSKMLPKTVKNPNSKGLPSKNSSKSGKMLGNGVSIGK